MYLNWVAVDWIVGSQAAGIVVAVVISVVVLFIAMIGFCILGCRQHMERTHILINHDKCNHTLAWLLPTISLCLFLTLCLFSMTDTNASTFFIRKHANFVFDSIDTSGDGKIVRDEFYFYMAQLPQYAKVNTTSTFQQNLVKIFDSMDSSAKDYLNRSDMYQGVLDSLSIIRFDFGASTIGICIIIAIFILVFWLWHNQLKESRYEDRVRRIAKASYQRARMEELSRQRNMENEDDDEVERNSLLR
jgi:hypothetical protein